MLDNPISRSGLNRREPAVSPADRSDPLPAGTWTIDPADTIVSVAWRTLLLGCTTGRRHGRGVIHLDELPPVGVIRFHQPSGLPVLAVDPAGVELGAAHRDAIGGGGDGFACRWWTLRSHSLEILPTGTWRVMATLTTRRSAHLVELHLEVDPTASGRDRLVLQGQGVVDRGAFGSGKRAWGVRPKLRLGLAVHATRVDPRTSPAWLPGTPANRKAS